MVSNSRTVIDGLQAGIVLKCEAILNRWGYVLKMRQRGNLNREDFRRCGKVTKLAWVCGGNIESLRNCIQSKAGNRNEGNRIAPVLMISPRLLMGTVW